MRYTLTDGNLQPVLKVTVDGLDVTNPTDELIDRTGTGYPLQTTPAPEYDPETQNLQLGYTQQQDYIAEVWTVTDKSKAERIAAIDARIDAVNEAYEAWKNNEPIYYPANGKGYLPRWVPEVYTPIRTLPATAFPITLTATDYTAEPFTQVEFISLYEYLLGASAYHIAEVNSQLAELEAQKQELL